MNKRTQAQKDQAPDASSRLQLPLTDEAETVFDSTRAVMMILDAEGHIVSVSQRFSDLMGYSTATLVGRAPPFYQIEPESLSWHQDMRRALDSVGVWHGQIQAQRKNGESLRARLHVCALLDAHGRSEHAVAMLDEVSSLTEMPSASIPDSAPSPELLQGLRRALAQNELVLFYQPKVNMRSGKVVGAEALLRWQHPDAGLLPPGAFLRQVEHHDLIVEIGDWVIRTALAQIAAWRRLDLNLHVSVNVAARHLQRADFVPSLKRSLAAQPDSPPEQLEIEILESAALENTRHVQRVMDACRELGVTFSLDDFGTGYASLAYLREITAEVLKIDRSFIKDLLEDSDDLILVEGVIGLARAFRRVVVAEGVETAEQGLMLMRLGCDIAQGYGIARPMPAAQLPDWVANYRPDPEWSMWADIPWEMEDFPLLVAKYDHISWVKRVLDSLANTMPLVPPEELNDHRKCRFAQWYYHQGKARFGNLPTFIELEQAHIEVHKLGAKVMQSLSEHRLDEAKALARELPVMRDAVLRNLDELQRCVVLDPTGQHNLREKPLRPGDAPAVQPLHAPHTLSSRKSRQPLVFIIDDTPTNIELLAAALSADYAIKFATSGAEALTLLEKPEKPDLILLDVMMPGMDGYQVCRHLKENPATRGIPVIFISAKSEVADQAHGFSLGAVDYITKPFELPVVLARVRTHINLKLRTDLLEAQALIDALTGIGNRRRFDEVLRLEWKRALRNIMPLSMLMLDVDHFKAYNDHYGHGAGDNCLLQIGLALRQAELRPGDFVARYGGEEFAVILPNCHAAGARAIGERIREEIESLQLPHAQSTSASVVTVSIGCATQRPARGGDIAGLLLAADQALYSAKQAGRNRLAEASS